MSRYSLFKIIQFALLAYVSIQPFLIPLPYEAYNAGNGILSLDLSKQLFRYIPIICVVLAVSIIFNKLYLLTKYLITLVSCSFFAYTVKVIYEFECAKCASFGILPLHSFNYQIIYFGVMVIVSLYLFLQSPLLHKSHT
jgi:hypothetical protein